MNKIKDFPFNDIVLYSKGWYERGDIVEDLTYLLSEVYGWSPKGEDQVARMMMRVLDRVYKDLDVPRDCCGRWYDTHSAFEDEVDKRMHFYNITRGIAIIQLVMSILLSLTKDEIELKAPHYGKHEHFRMGSIGAKNPISMTYKEMNNRAKKAFGNN
jgi:hypothetical protein